MRVLCILATATALDLSAILGTLETSALLHSAVNRLQVPPKQKTTTDEDVSDLPEGFEPHATGLIMPEDEQPVPQPRLRGTSPMPGTAGAAPAMQGQHPPSCMCKIDVVDVCDADPTTAFSTPGLVYENRMCLKDNDSQVSQKCRDAINAFPSVVEQCYWEIKSFCSEVTPGDNRIHECLTQNRDMLQPPCSGFLNQEAQAAQDDASVMMMMPPSPFASLFGSLIGAFTSGNAYLSITTYSSSTAPMSDYQLEEETFAGAYGDEPERASPTKELYADPTSPDDYAPVPPPPMPEERHISLLGFLINLLFWMTLIHLICQCCCRRRRRAAAEREETEWEAKQRPLML